MKKNTLYIIFKIIIALSLLFISINTFAEVGDISLFSGVEEKSLDPNWNTDIVNEIGTKTYALLVTLKRVLMWVFVIFMVYTWIMMITSRWSDEEELSKAKRQIWYWVVAILFINIPWTIYESFNPTVSSSSLWGNIWYTTWLDNPAFNIFFNVTTFENTLGNKIIWFLQVLAFGIAVFFIMLSWIKILTSRWREDEVKESKMKITYSIMALIFLWLIESWKEFAFDWDIAKWTDFFATVANLALFIAAPVAILFLTIAAYYYITSSWDEERIKKAKSIVINTTIATVLLLAAYTFLLDLGTL